jgi:superfamily II DNA/RNA helicase
VDHLENTRGFHLKSVKYLVMDEADRILNMDFEEEVDKLLAEIPKVPIPAPLPTRGCSMPMPPSTSISLSLQECGAVECVQRWAPTAPYCIPRRNALTFPLSTLRTRARPLQERTTFLFSATMTSKVQKLQRASLVKPVKIEVSSKYQTVDTLIQKYIFVPQTHKVDPRSVHFTPPPPYSQNHMMPRLGILVVPEPLTEKEHAVGLPWLCGTHTC